MAPDNWAVSCSAVLLLFIACAATISAAPMASAAAGSAQIAVLYDAFGEASTIQKDWGYAAFVEYGRKRILFDTGNNPDILAQNTSRTRPGSQRRIHGETAEDLPSCLLVAGPRCVEEARLLGSAAVVDKVLDVVVFSDIEFPGVTGRVTVSLPRDIYRHQLG